MERLLQQKQLPGLIWLCMIAVESGVLFQEVLDPVALEPDSQDGSVVAWGDADWGGDSSHVQDQLYMVSYVCGTFRAFLELRANGTFLLGDDATHFKQNEYAAHEFARVCSTSVCRCIVFCACFFKAKGLTFSCARFTNSSVCHQMYLQQIGF